MAETQLIIAPAPPELLMPVFSLEQAAHRSKQFKQFVKNELHEGVDFTVARGGQKPALTKAGAEKLGTFFGHKPRFHEDEKINDWTGDEHGGQPLFAYTYTCTLERDGVYLGQASGHCNTWEQKYRWRWMSQDQIPKTVDLDALFKREAILEEFQFALDKKETTGDYGRPMEYWQTFERAIANKTAEHIRKETKSGRDFPAVRIVGVQYRVPNPDPYDGVNTALKISQKRSYVAAELIVCNASDFFSQDFDEEVPWSSGPPDHPPPQERRSSSAARPSAPPPPPPQQTQRTDAPPPPPPDPEPEVPEPVQKIWARMAKQNKEQRVAEFHGLMKALMEARGEDAGQACYYSILGQERVQHPSQFRTLGPAQKTIHRLWIALQNSLGEDANLPPGQMDESALSPDTGEEPGGGGDGDEGID